MSRRTKTSVKRSCDAIWAKVVKVDGVCECCAGNADNAHHAYGRKNHRLRFEIRNGVSLCYACHRWVHNEPLGFAAWFMKRRPADYDWLKKENAKGTIHRTLHDYLELEADLRGLLESGVEGAGLGV